MWCTRWYLPLLLLPMPKAPAYFLVLYLISLTLHSRPCFYCVVLLSAMFVSSCYWQPLSTDSLLSSPWNENITTFSDLVNITELPLPPNSSFLTPAPTVIKLVDHCWCDWADIDFFKPFNATRWELQSVRREQAKRVMVIPAAMLEKVSGEGDEQNRDGDEAGDGDEDMKRVRTATTQDGISGAAIYRLKETTKNGGTDESIQRNPSLASRVARRLRESFGLFTSPEPLRSTDPTPPPTLHVGPESLQDTSMKNLRHSAGLFAPWRRWHSLAPTPSSSDQQSSPSPVSETLEEGDSLPSAPSEPLPWLRSEYDLRPYGVELIVDFNWGRKD